MSRLASKNIYKKINGITSETEENINMTITVDKETMYKRVIPFNRRHNRNLATHQATKIVLDNKDCNTGTVDMQKLKTNRILVIGLVKDVSKHIVYLKYFINQLQTIFNTVDFFYLTNNNTDNTNDIMIKWSDETAHVKGIEIADEDVTIVDIHNKRLGNRIQKLAKFRNILFQKAKMTFGTNYDFLLQIDTDLIANVSAESFATCFQIKDDFDIICANAVFINSLYHYDVFALRLLNDPSDINEIYPLFHNYYGISVDWITKLYVFREWTRVRSAWGGMMLMHPKVFNMNKLYDENCPTHECEHISLCRKFHNVFINSNLTYIQDYKVEGSVYSAPMLFVPRDAGFFSVFNFYVGTLLRCGRVYPFWNIDRFKIENKVTKPHHFCYFNKDNKNCWFDFFEKVQFYQDDDIHQETIDEHSFSYTVGLEAPDEFKMPNVTKDLLEDKNNTFREWRRKVNAIFKTHIKLNTEMDELVSGVTSSLFKDVKKMIGIHYRHPSHSCEQGEIFLRDYFHKIDMILEKHKDAGIYLATDNDFGICAFKARYGARLGYIEGITRTSVDNILEWAYARGKGNTDNVGFINNKGYELHHSVCNDNSLGDPQIGKDVILEVYCLSKCNWFIFTQSNLALAVSYINPDVEMIMVQ